MGQFCCPIPILLLAALSTPDSSSSGFRLILPTMPNDRRRHTRYKTVLPVEIGREGQSFGVRGETTDVSTSGFYYSTMMQMPVGTMMNVKVWFDDTSLTCKAVVRTADPGVGNGIEFVDLDPKSQEALEQFLSTLPES